MLMAYKIIHNQQQAWAHQREIKFDKDGYTFSLDDNLLFSLLPEVKKEFQPHQRGRYLELQDNSVKVRFRP